MADPTDERAAGFLGRWARRKNDALLGKPLDEPVPVRKVGAASLGTEAPSAILPAGGAVAAQAADEKAPQPAEAPTLSMDDVKDLTKDSDFKPFMNRGVEPGVRNAAMKKLFADPHFNVMDRMDIYIDDYSQPDPLPLSMLRQMASAKFLGLFDEEDDKDKTKDGADALQPTQDLAIDSARESLNRPDVDSVAQSAPAHDEPGVDAVAPPDPHSPTQALTLAEHAENSQEKNADLDLRLQPDHAPPASGAGHGT